MITARNGKLGVCAGKRGRTQSPAAQPHQYSMLRFRSSMSAAILRTSESAIGEPLSFGTLVATSLLLKTVTEGFARLSMNQPGSTSTEVTSIGPIGHLRQPVA